MKNSSNGEYYYGGWSNTRLQPPQYLPTPCDCFPAVQLLWETEPNGSEWGLHVIWKQCMDLDLLEIWLWLLMLISPCQKEILLSCAIACDWWRIKAVSLDLQAIMWVWYLTDRSTSADPFNASPLVLPQSVNQQARPINVGCLLRTVYQ